MYTLYVYKGHWENGVFLRDYLYEKLYFKSIKKVRHHLTINKADFDSFDYLIESSNGEFNYIYRYNF